MRNAKVMRNSGENKYIGADEWVRRLIRMRVTRYFSKSSGYLRIRDFFRIQLRGRITTSSEREMTKGRSRNERGWRGQQCRGKERRVARVQQVAEVKARSTDVKSRGNKKVALILAGRTNKGSRDNELREGAFSGNFPRGKNGGKRNKRLKTPAQWNFIEASPVSLLFFALFLSFRGNSTYRKQMRLGKSNTLRISVFITACRVIHANKSDRTSSRDWRELT